MSIYFPAATACFLLGAAFLFFGVAVLREGGRERLHRTTALMLLFVGIGGLIEGLRLALRVSAPAGTEIYEQALDQFSPLWEFFFPTLLVFTLLYPTELPIVRRYSWIPELLYVPYFFHLVLVFVGSISNETFFLVELAERAGWAGTILTPLRVGLSLLYDAHLVLFTLVNLVYIAATMTILPVRSRRIQNPRLRQQTWVIFAGISLCLISYTLGVAVPQLFGVTEEWSGIRAPLLVVALASGGGSIGLAIIRYRFLDAQYLMRRSLAFIVVAAVLSGLYVLVVGRLEVFLGRFTALDIRLVEPVLLVAALVLLQPLAVRLEEVVSRAVLRDRREGRVVLEELSRDVVTLMDLDQLGSRLTQAVFESLVVDGAALLARRAPGAAFERVAIAGFDGHSPDWSGVVAHLDGLDGARGVVRVRQLDVLGGSPESAALAEAARQVPLEVLMPLSHGSELLGLLALGPKATRTRFAAEDLLLLAALGNQAAAAIRNSHLLEENLRRAALQEDLALARRIQFAYLPLSSPSLPTCQMAARNIPSREVGGDYFDFLEMNGQLLVVTADVVGKGMPAALLMSMLQASLRTLAAEPRRLTEIAERLNHMILQSRETGRFATVFLGLFDPETQWLAYSNAGHNPPCLMRRDGRIEWLTEGGTLLGAFENSLACEGRLQLEPGDRIVLYTDGITEAPSPSGEFFGEERLAAAVAGVPFDAPAEELVEGVLHAVRGFLDGGEPADDMTVVALRIPALVEAGV